MDTLEHYKTLSAKPTEGTWLAAGARTASSWSSRFCWSCSLDTIRSEKRASGVSRDVGVTEHDSENAERRSRKARQALTSFGLVAGLGIAFATPRAGAQARPDVDELLIRVGQRIAEFYERAQHVICFETSTVQPIDFRFSPQGFARIVESELRVEIEGGDVPGEATVVREVRKVNGRPPREKDKKDRVGCTDPNPLSTEPLAFLLPAHREEYEFRSAGFGKDRNRPVVLIDFASVNRKSNPELIEDKSGHDDCFDWSGHVASRGRVWVDANSYDVVRLERGLRGPLDVKVPLRIQRRHNLDNYVVIEREDTTIRYRTVAFSDPDEVLLLPESIESLIVARSRLQSTRRSQTYSNYKRFVTASKVVE